jgi:hypothetical protein
VVVIGSKFGARQGARKNFLGRGFRTPCTPAGYLKPR